MGFFFPIGRAIISTQIESRKGQFLRQNDWKRSNLGFYEGFTRDDGDVLPGVALHEQIHRVLECPRIEEQGGDVLEHDP